ncbi:gamma-glutamylcyclotransferase family protein [Leptonema illini]|uniref:AIG2 family protein n=1 Tax=Leptonema illini DSM 21528 TaxID=929563 RepID=H2CIR6_9LEPT|nr:gamma-glutamylcyclotransferase family protein [Leptonema illini]EHQ07082.1 AIG2 family protein [Leptonema illini DSM 21528]
MYYFAYGSNMDMADLSRWCKDKGHDLSSFCLHKLGIAYLEDFKLAFNYYSTLRKAGAANIMPSKGNRVYGLLFEVDEKTRDQILRPKEGHPKHYLEMECKVIFNDSPVEAITYKVVLNKEKSGHQHPTKEYLNLIVSNGCENGFPKDYMTQLTVFSTL